MINSHSSVGTRRVKLFTVRIIKEHFMVIAKDTVIVPVRH